MKALQDLAAPVSRILLSAIFILAGINKIGGYYGTMQYMEAYGVPGALLPLVIAAEIGLGLAVAFGILSRLAALGLAVFTLVSAIIFHNDLGDQTQFVMFMKNLAITGGLLLIWIHGPGAYAIDNTGAMRRFSR